ncbi:toxin-antitoxin system YwqK family antitoxin [Anatilimnocola floriformis]|uniref:toxin-antitoxin system YwqK family antitoxin n=1 Tax=Anatilimnocola floriformis TaxID=2948575 RepID=UPI0020C571DA|nr:hypothetical protein [Anatilimnocola floriformis]
MASAAPLRIWRIQFTLRTLLVMLTCIGAGLAIYRWPWVETYESPGPGSLQLNAHASLKFARGAWRCELSGSILLPRFVSEGVTNFRVTTTRRRGWNGRALRHGPAEYWRLPDVGPPELFLRCDYSDDERTCLTWFEHGEVVYTESHRDGKLHGANFDRDSFLSSHGNYERGQRVGAWKETRHYGTDETGPFPLELTHSFRDGLFDGDWIWKSSRSGVLQTAKYDSGQLIEWNGKPVRRAMEDLLTPLNLSAEDRQRLLAPASLVKFDRLPQTPDSTIHEWQGIIDGQRTGLVIRQTPEQFRGMYFFLFVDEIEFHEHSETSPLQIVLEHALVHHDTLIIREGKLIVERIHHLETEEQRP